MRRHSMQDILLFVVFSIFAVLSLVLIAVGIRFYTSISHKVENNSEIRSSVSYIENKLRSSDYEGGVEIAKVDNTDVILLSNPNSSMKTAIYVSDGKLKEYLVSDNNIRLGYGDTIADMTSMNVNKTDNTIDITLYYDGTHYSINKTMNAGAL